jgi:endonuclease III
MSSGNRSVKYESLYKSLKKHYKPVSDPPERSVLECLLYACCLEDARLEQADEAFAKLQQTYFDWNEVRVTTVAELAEALKALPFPAQAAARIKQCLQSVFEARYQYDIDDLKKANLGKAVAEIEAWKGITPFVVAYVSQHALGGHAIPAGQVIYEAMWQCEILTFAEIDKKSLPGIERAIPKNKGIEFAGLLHQFANDLFHHPKSAAPSTILKEMGVTWKTKPKPAAPEKNNSSNAGSDANTAAKAGQAASALKVAAGSKAAPAAKAVTPVKTETPAKTETPDKGPDKHPEKGGEKAAVGKAAPVKAESQAKPSGKVPEKPAAKPAIKVETAAPAAHRPKPKVLGLGKGPLAKGAIKPPSNGTGSDKKSKSAGGKSQPGKSNGGKSGGSKGGSSKPDSKTSGKPVAGKVDASKSAKGNAKPAKKSDKNSKDTGKKPTSSGKSDAKKSDTSKKSTGKSSGSLGTSLTKKKPK